MKRKKSKTKKLPQKITNKTSHNNKTKACNKTNKAQNYKKKNMINLKKIRDRKCF